VLGCGLDRAIAYLTAKQPYLHYRQALAMGWPTATGVIEGACRHLVNDRLAITGARWSLPGAEAVRLLRALITNGDLDTCWTFHIQQERQTRPHQPLPAAIRPSRMINQPATNAKNERTKERRHRPTPVPPQGCGQTCLLRRRWCTACRCS
jgi:hypothetical protein